MQIRKATSCANSNIAFIKWTIRQHVAHYVDRTAGDWNEEPRIRRAKRAVATTIS
jgi:hypothetical protein